MLSNSWTSLLPVQRTWVQLRMFPMSSRKLYCRISYFWPILEAREVLVRHKPQVFLQDPHKLESLRILMGVHSGFQHSPVATQLLLLKPSRGQVGLGANLSPILDHNVHYTHNCHEMCEFIDKLTLEAGFLSLPRPHFRPKHVCLKMSTKAPFLGMPPQLCDRERSEQWNSLRGN